MTAAPCSARSVGLRPIAGEYLGQNEVQGTPRPFHITLPGRGDFTLRGHRLSSLYRERKARRLTLTLRCPAPIILGKILPPEAPTQVILGIVAERSA